MTWNRLLALGLVSGPPPQIKNQERQPWYLQAMLGVAGWIAALFLTGFIMLITSWSSSPGILGIIGCGLCAGGIFVLRNNDFSSITFSQAGLASLVAGNCIIAAALGTGANGWPWWAAIVLILLSGTAFVLSVGFLPRLLMTIAVVTSGAVWLGIMSDGNALAFPVGFLTVAAFFLLLWKSWTIQWRQYCRPAAWGLILCAMVLAVIPMSGWGLRFSSRTLEIAAVIIALFSLPMPMKWPQRSFILLGVASIIVTWAIPGASPALVLILVGIGQRERPMLILGLIAIVALVVTDYSRTDSTLLHKSLGLGLSGVLALVARWGLRRPYFIPPQQCA